MKYLVNNTATNKRVFATDSEMDGPAHSQATAEHFADWLALETKNPMCISKQDAGITEILYVVQP